jgi:hypothetical protein
MIHKKWIKNKVEKMSDGKKLTEAITVRFPPEVMKAIEKRARDQSAEFPRYNEGDVIRIAVVVHLKEKGYLDKEKTYL